MYKSKLWEEIMNRFKAEHFDLLDFRNPRKSWINSRLASWQPSENSLRWYRSFLNICCLSLSGEEVNLYRSFEDTQLGQPIFTSKSYEGGALSLNLDYLLSCKEISFLNENFRSLDTKFPDSILEIGAGFGRTCHSIFMTQDIESYIIVDLPEMLAISKIYLSRVLPFEKFAKIMFIEPNMINTIVFSDYLCIQIDGFQEMDPPVIDNYFVALLNKSKYFFSSNPIGKYLPEHAGISTEEVNSSLPNPVFDLGYSRDVFDIWNFEEIEAHRKSHISRYCPEGFRVVHSQKHSFFPHYENTLYAREDE